MRGSTDCAGMGDERRDDAADRRRADVYSSARIGAAAALTLVLVVAGGHGSLRRPMAMASGNSSSGGPACLPAGSGEPGVRGLSGSRQMPVRPLR